MEIQFGKILTKLEAKKEDNGDATKIDPYAIAWTVKRKDKLSPLVVGHISKEILRFKKLFLNNGGRIEANVFSSQYKSSPIPSGELEIPPVVKFSISEVKSAMLKHLQNMIDLNYEELTSMDTSQNVIVEEELRQNYNSEDEDILLMFLLMVTVKVTETATHRTVFVIVIKKVQKHFFYYLKLFRILKFRTTKNFEL